MNSCTATLRNTLDIWNGRFWPGRFGRYNIQYILKQNDWTLFERRTNQLGIRKLVENFIFLAMVKIFQSFNSGHSNLYTYIHIGIAKSDDGFKVQYITLFCWWIVHVNRRLFQFICLLFLFFKRQNHWFSPNHTCTTIVMEWRERERERKSTIPR